MVGFIFGGDNLPKTPQDLARQRAMVAALMSSQRAPKNVGEGLSALGDGIVANVLNRRASEGETAGLQSATDAFNPIIAALGGTQAPAPADSVDVPTQKVAQAFGDAPGPANDYYAAIRQAESGGNDNAKAPTSSATGRYQFTGGTWADLMQSHPELGLTSDGRLDPNQQEKAIRAFTQDNAGILNGAGIPTTGGNLYAAHFLGAGGAKNVLSQPDNTPMASAVGADVIRANPFLARMTVGDFKQWAARKGGGAQVASLDPSAGMAAPPLPAPRTIQDRPVAQVAQAAPAQNGGPTIQQLLQAGSNPWMDENQSAMVRALLGQQLKQMDPNYSLDAEYKRAQIDKLRNPNARDKFGNSVIWGQNENGDWVAMQPSSGGGLIAAETPEGIKLAPPGLGHVNSGTSNTFYDRAGNLINNVPIDNAGKAAAAAEGKGLGEAKLAYDSMTAKLPGLEQVVSQLDDLANQATYTTAGQLYDAGRKELGLAPRDAAVARTKYIATVSNQILPLLRDTFGAQFTAREGDTLVATLGDPDKTPAEKQAVLKAFIEQKKRDIEALARQTGQTQQQPQTGGGNDDPLGIR